MTLNRRDLLKAGIGGALAAGALGGLSLLSGAVPPTKAGDDSKWSRRAQYWRALAQDRVKCLLCPRGCETDPGERGFCGVRENRGGELRTLVYGRAASINVDPIEKKPFFHVLPGSPVFSFATAGCNMACKNCQNWQLSQSRPEEVPARDLPPAKLVDLAKKQSASLIAGTYSEPTVFTEYLLDVAREGNKRGLRTVSVTAGQIARAPMVDLCRELAAVKIDLKSMREEFYRSNCQGTLKPVLATIELVRERGVWLEIVYLVIPTLNDSDEEIKDLARWVRTHVGAEVPLHFSRFHPQHRLKNLPPTPYATLDRCQKLAAAEGLEYVYVGNLPGHPAESTFCPKCGKILIRREGFRVNASNVTKGRCKFCRHPIPGIWA